MNKLINYLKYVSIFLIIELMITFIMSLLNLLGVNSGITTIIMLVCNLILFFILNYFNAFKLKKKGFLEGIILGFIFIIFMILIKVILFNSGFGISTFIYYTILFIISILGGMFGVNKKSDNK
ncbi:MAG: TIGR04086 family membrane protein [Firmicutes bacterium]|nr:TIGR04086 family membrane protein [Bacillota bacterium]